MAERANLVFHNKEIDGTAMKRLISRLIDHFGMGYTSHILDQIKTLGFHQATTTSISLGIERNNRVFFWRNTIIMELYTR